MASFDLTHDDVSLTQDPIDFTHVINSVRSVKAGAVANFLGTTRDFFEGHTVVELQYEAYEDMAIVYLKSICEKIRQKWAVDKICIQHKIGNCPIGEISVAIAVSSEHRKEALEAVSFAINELKATVPIWKKECYADADAIWKENSEHKAIKESNVI